MNLVRGAGLAALLLAFAAVPPARAGDEDRIHEVKPGETLWTIASASIGDATLWPALYRANRDQIKDPALLYPGQRLSIPAVEPSARPALRRLAETLARPDPEPVVH